MASQPLPRTPSARPRANVGRPRLAPGERGEPWVQQIGPNKFAARVRIRGRDGRIHEVSARGTTKGAALRELTRRVDQRQATQVGAPVGVVPNMTLTELGDYWLQHRARHGLERRQGAVKPQTLAAYADAIRLLIHPHLGGIQIRELTIGLLESALADIENIGLSTSQARSALNQMLALATRHGAIATNPMSLVAKPLRTPHEVHALTIPQAQRLRTLVDPSTQRKPGTRGPNPDLADLVDVLLGTGCRIGEALALTWNKVDLSGDRPIARIDGTLVEPKSIYVPTLHRQDDTKSHADRALLLPDALADVLTRRRDTATFTDPADPVFASRNRTWLWPNNLRTRLRTAVANDPELAQVTPHTLRRTVGTLIAHELSLDAARDVLGHTDPSVTFRSYVARRTVAPDVRDLLDQFFD